MSIESRDSLPARHFSGRRWMIACITLQGLIVLISAVLPVKQEDSIGFRLMFSILLTQNAVAAGWLVFGPGKPILRLAVVPFWGLIAAAIAGIFSRPHDGFKIILGVCITVTLVMVFILLLSRWFFSVRLFQETAILNERQFQFRITDLVYLTLATSVFLALGRWAIESGLIPPLSRSGPWLFIPLLGLTWAIPLIPAFFVPLSKTQIQGSVTPLLLGGLLMTAVIGALGCYLMVKVMEANLMPEFSSRYRLIEIPVIAYLLVCISLLMIRKAGYRLGVVGRGSQI